MMSWLGLSETKSSAALAVSFRKAIRAACGGYWQPARELLGDWGIEMYRAELMHWAVTARLWRIQGDEPTLEIAPGPALAAEIVACGLRDSPYPNWGEAILMLMHGVKGGVVHDEAEELKQSAHAMACALALGTPDGYEMRRRFDPVIDELAAGTPLHLPAPAPPVGVYEYTNSGRRIWIFPLGCDADG
jgi:hypothetical protein